MAEKKIIAVVGATGAQGGGLARAIAADASSEFSIRAITRQPDSEKANALRDLGAEVVAGDLDDLESLKAAFAGAYGVFCVTNFWEHFDPEREFVQGRNQAEAAKAASVEHAIWSTLEDSRNWVPLEDDRMPTLLGKYKVPHFDAKGEVNRVFEELGVPTTMFQTAFYWENLFLPGMLAAGADGKLALTFPMGNALLPAIGVEDIGKSAYGIFKEGSELIGKTVSISGENLSIAEMVSKIGAALGQEVVYNDVPADLYRSFEFPGADEMGNMFQLKRDFNDDYAGVRDPEYTRSLNPELKDFDSWLKDNVAKLPTGSAV